MRLYYVHRKGTGNQYDYPIKAMPKFAIVRLEH